MTWICYILRSENSQHCRKTYNGATVNFKRRLRQHNGEIVGGAKYTRGKGPWKPLCLVTGFQNKKEALQAEWRIKRVSGKRRHSKYCGPEGRIKSLVIIFNRSKFTSNSTQCIQDGHFVIYIDNDYRHLLEEESLPECVTVQSLDQYFVQ